MLNLLKGIAAAVAVLCALAAPATAASSRAQTVAGDPGLEQGVLAAINDFRAQHHLAPLRLNRSLSAAADAHSLAMARRGFFAHESADGSAFWKRVRRFYSDRGFSRWSVGENLLWSSGTLDAAAALKLWMGSPGHRKNILTARWREIGLSALKVSSAPGVYGGRDVVIITTDFGVRS